MMRYMLLSLLIATAVEAKPQELEPLVIPADAVVVHLEEMTDEQYADFREGKLGDIVVRVDEGSLLRTHFVIMGDTLALEESPAMKVRVLRTLFLRVRQGNLEFSFDCQEWGRLPEIFRPNLAMLISVDHDVPTGAFALFLTGRS